MSAVLLFFAITYLASWTFFSAAGYVLNRPGSPASVPLAGVLFLFGTIMPSLIALILTAVKEGRTGVRVLLAGLSKWSVGARWYLFALG